MAVSFIGEASHWQTLSHNVVSSTPSIRLDIWVSINEFANQSSYWFIWKICLQGLIPDIKLTEPVLDLGNDDDNISDIDIEEDKRDVKIRRTVVRCKTRD